MPRHVIERTFPTGLGIAATAAGAMDCRALVDRNAEEGVTWLQSYVSANEQGDLLRLRGAHAGSDQAGSGPQRTARRPDHPGPRSRSPLRCMRRFGPCAR